MSRSILAASQADVGSVEYLVNEADGQVYYYDVNPLSNFVADAPNVVGFDPFARFVDYVLRASPHGNGENDVIEMLFLSKEDVEATTLELGEVMDVVEMGLRAHGEKKVIMPSKDHLVLEYPYRHFNLLKGYVEPIDVAGVKVIGDFEKNYQHNLPSELALLTLYDPETGAPLAIMDATLITWMRTGAVTAVGAKHLPVKSRCVLGHIGARGTSRYNVPMLDLPVRLPGDPRHQQAARVSRALCCRDVPANGQAGVGQGNERGNGPRRGHHHRCFAPGGAQILVKDAWVKPGAHLQAYGAVASTERTLPFTVDKMVVDDWNQALKSPMGQFTDLIQAGKLGAEHIHAEIGEVVAGLKPGRESNKSAFSSGTRDLPSATSCWATSCSKGRGNWASGPLWYIIGNHATCS